MTSGNISFSSGIRRLIPSPYNFSGFISFVFILLYIKGSRNSGQYFFTNLFLVFYVLKIIIEITYWNSRRTSVIILFSSKGKIFVHSQKLPLVWEGFSIPVLLLIKLLVVLTYSPVLTEYSEVFVRIWVFASFVYWMVSLSYRFSFSWSIDPSRF